jgi:hypothetical protein
MDTKLYTKVKDYHYATYPIIGASGGGFGNKFDFSAEVANGWNFDACIVTQCSFTTRPGEPVSSECGAGIFLYDKTGLTLVPRNIGAQMWDAQSYLAAKTYTVYCYPNGLQTTYAHELYSDSALEFFFQKPPPNSVVYMQIRAAATDTPFGAPQPMVATVTMRFTKVPNMPLTH